MSLARSRLRRTRDASLRSVAVLAASLGCSTVERRDVDPGGASTTSDAALPASAPEPPRPLESLDRLLERCPTELDVAGIRADFDIAFDPALLAESASTGCTERGDESSAVLSTYNMFRALRAIEFDREMPLLGTRRPYDWLAGAKLRVHVFDARSSREPSFATDDTVHLNGRTLAEPSRRRWVAAETYGGLQDSVARLMHEARHTRGGGGYPHDCGEDDTSTDYGGAWTVERDFYAWIAEHAMPSAGGPSVSTLARAVAQKNAEVLLGLRFCTTS